jgi:hypothetical protein
LELSVEPVEDIRLHEEVVPELLREMASALKEEGAQLDPVIVDGRTGVALDGMHRIQALKEIGAKRALVCKVNYFDPHIRLRRWLRTYVGINTPLLEDLKVKLNLTRTTVEDAMKRVDRGLSPVGLLAWGWGYCSMSKPRSVLHDLQYVRTFDSTAADHGVRPALTEDSGVEGVSARGFVLYARRPRKMDVIRAATMGAPMPPKTTRHLVPARPVGIGYPLDWLTDEGISGGEARERLRRLLEARRVKHLKPGTEYKGRVYEESLYLYEG